MLLLEKEWTLPGWHALVFVGMRVSFGPRGDGRRLGTLACPRGRGHGTQGRRLLRRDVELIDLEALPAAVEARRLAGYEYGDFQFDIDPASKGFLRRGVFSCYCPVAAPVADSAMGGVALTPDRWRAFVMLAHTDKAEAYRRYTEMYLASHGKHYWSDAAQMNYYEPGYHTRIDQALGHAGSEMITELYVPAECLGDFMARAALDFRADDVDVIYGTVRFIRADLETFLPWAKRDYACIVFNIHTPHEAAALAALKRTTRRLIGHALALEGSYYLTYHRNASAEQVLEAYPRFAQFLAWKRYYDPAERFQSEWYRHYRGVIG